MGTEKSKHCQAKGLSRARLREMLEDLLTFAGRIREFREVKRKVGPNGIVRISGEIVMTTYAAYATFYDGLVTNDKKLEAVYLNTRHLLRTLFGVPT